MQVESDWSMFVLTKQLDGLQAMSKNNRIEALFILFLVSISNTVVFVKRTVAKDFKHPIK